MSFVVIIPARYQSSRLPGKPLADIHGQSMIQRVVKQAEKSGASATYVATDNEDIKSHVESFGGKVVMTRADHESGTDRLYEASQTLKLADDTIVVNVQGDEPFIPPDNIRQVADLLSHPNAVMATLSTPIDSMTDVNDPNVVKVVANNSGQAIYFSRSVIPFDREKQIENIDEVYQRHIGIYGYRAGFLKTFSELPVARLESLEKLEQLRVLENGYAIQIAQSRHVPPMGVDTKHDLQKAIDYAQSLEK